MFWLFFLIALNIDRSVSIISDINSRLADYIKYYCNIWDCIPSKILSDSYPYQSDNKIRQINQKIIFQKLRQYFIKTKTHALFNRKNNLYTNRIRLFEDIVMSLEPNFNNIYK